MFLILIDSYSKWMEIFATSSTTSAVTVRFLKSLFVQFGLPHLIVTDNATNLISDEFNTEEWLRTTPSVMGRLNVLCKT